jgi:hypothetical protein
MTTASPNVTRMAGRGSLPSVKFSRPRSSTYPTTNMIGTTAIKATSGLTPVAPTIE